VLLVEEDEQEDEDHVDLTVRHLRVTGQNSNHTVQ